MKALKKCVSILFSLVAGVSCLAFTACGGCASSRLPDDGQEDEQPLPHVHSYGEWSVRTPPTCTEKGSRERNCECGEKQTEELPVEGHKFSEEWTKDGTYHWHASVCGHDVTDGKAEHDFENGSCKVCKKYAPLTEDTDFGALVSEKVDEAGWERAFTVSEYKNCTEKHLRKDLTTCYNKISVSDGTTYVEFLLGEGENADHEFHTYDGEKCYSYLPFDPYTGNKDGEWHKIENFTDPEASEEQNKKHIDWRLFFVVCPDFGNFYSCFTYNEERGGYENNPQSPIKTNEMLAASTMTYDKVFVKIIDGKLAYLEIFDPADSDFTCVYFYDFGNTEVIMPEYEEV